MILIITHVENENAGTIDFYLKQWGYRTYQVALWNGDSLSDVPNKYRAIIIMGGPMSVYDEDKYPFLISEKLFLKDAIEKGKPILGICLGAQILANVFGAKVHLNKCKEVGWYDVELTEWGKSSILFRGIPEKFKVFQWHNDVFDVPRGAYLTVRSDNCENQAFEVESRFFGIQFHFEVKKYMIKEWINDLLADEKSIDDELIERVYWCIDKYIDELEKISRTICNNFVSLI